MIAGYLNFYIVADFFATGTSYCICSKGRMWGMLLEDCIEYPEDLKEEGSKAVVQRVG